VTDRKPPGVSWESWIDKRIREGQEQGLFDDLPGHGQPIADLDRPHDELWWVRKKLRDEEVAFLPPALAIRQERDEALDRIRRATCEEDVRRIIEDINERIRYVNSHVVSGPPTTVMPLDVERTVQQWRDAMA
jgi:hypothetical protein